MRKEQRFFHLKSIKYQTTKRSHYSDDIRLDMRVREYHLNFVCVPCCGLFLKIHILGGDGKIFNFTFLFERHKSDKKQNKGVVGWQEVEFFFFLSISFILNEI